MLSCFYRLVRALSLFRLTVGFFPKLYILPWLEKRFKIMLFRLLEMAFASQKTESIHLYLFPPGKTIHQVFVITPVFFQNMSPLQKGGGTMNSHYKAWSHKKTKHKKIKAYILKAIYLIDQREAFYRQRIPESSCKRKESIDIEIL